MNSTSPTLSRPLRAEQLRGLLVHVDAEEISLRNVIRLLQDVMSRTLDDDSQREVRLRIEQSLMHVELLEQNRSRVLGGLASQAGLAPDALTISRLIPLATAEAASLLAAARVRLHRLVRQVRAMAATAAWIVGETRRIHLTVLDSLPGAASSDRYDASGQRHLDPAAFRFEARS